MKQRARKMIDVQKKKKTGFSTPQMNLKTVLQEQWLELERARWSQKRARRTKTEDGKWSRLILRPASVSRHWKNARATAMQVEDGWSAAPVVCFQAVAVRLIVVACSSGSHWTAAAA